jgi:methionine-S-sulfoxide reductase
MTNDKSTILDSKSTSTAVYAGGCFWCTEHDLREVAGVIDVVSGYARGQQSETESNSIPAVENPTYQNHNGYMEAVLVKYDADKTSFKKLTHFFLDHIDPTDAGGQFFDRGSSYKTAIFYKNEDEKNVAESLITELGNSGIYEDPIVVSVLPEGKFYTAEDYHQNYASKNPDHYYAYRDGSGRSAFQAKTCSIREQKKIQWKD